MFRGLVTRLVTACLLGSLLTSTALLVGPARPAAAEPEGNFGGFFSEDHKVYAHHPRWMSNLPDNLLIGQLSIPATHDSAAQVNNNTSQTQTLTIEQQLETGIRSFDLRYVCKGKNTPDNMGPVDKLEAWHGSNNQNLDIEDIFQDFRDFLTDNPREFLLFTLGDESANDPLGQPQQDTCDGRTDDAVAALKSDPRWAALFFQDADHDGLEDRNETNKYGTSITSFDTDNDALNDNDELYHFGLNPLKDQTDGTYPDSVRFSGGDPFVQNFFEDTDHDGTHGGASVNLDGVDSTKYQAPRLGELRGRIVDVKSDNFAQVTRKGLPDSPNNGEWKVCFTPISGCAYGIGDSAVADPDDRLEDGDDYVYQKINVIANHIDEANTAPWSRLYSSDMSGSTFVIPRDAARGTSEDSGISGPILNYLVNNHPTYTKVGIISMDFPGPGLISRIIHYNQRYGLLPKPMQSYTYDGHTFTQRSAQDGNPEYEVGVLKGEGSCGDNAEVSVRMDTEDTNSSNEASGWIGGSSWDSHQVTLVFCRVKGDANTWIPPTHGFYGLLKLGDRCPAYSNEIYRTSDNEDDDNNNQSNGDFMANDLGAGSGYTGPFVGDSTRFTICSFNALDRPAGSTAGYPDLGFPYGVFGTPVAGGFAMDYGWVSADDEDDNNSNDANPDFDSPSWGGMLSGRKRYTVFHTMKVRGISPPTLTTNPAQPANNGRVPIDYHGSDGVITVTAKDAQGNPAVLSDNPPNLHQRATFLINTANVNVSEHFDLNSAGKASYNAADLPPGDYDVTIIYDDQRAHFSSSQTTLKITVADDPTAPTITPTSPTFGQKLGAGQFNNCTSFDPNVSGHGICGVVTSNDPIERVRVNLHGPNGKWWDGTGFNANDPLVLDAPLHLQVSPSTGGGQKFFLPVNPTAMPTGAYFAFIEAAETIATSDLNVFFTFDNTAPVVSFQTPAANGGTYSANSFGEECTAPAQIGLCGFIDENESGISQLDVSLSYNGGSFTPQNVQYRAVPGVPGRFAWWVPIDRDDIQGGDYVVDVHVLDGGANEVSVQRGFSVNAEPPDVTITAPAMNPNTTKLLSSGTEWPTPCSGGGGNRRVGRFCGTATDDLGVIKVEFSIRNTQFQYYDFTTDTWDTQSNQGRPATRKLIATASGPWAFDFPGTLTDGKYYVNVVASDAHGGQADYPVNFVWDTSGPQVEVTINGTKGAGGWYTSALRFEAKDPGELAPTTCVVTPARVEVSTEDGHGSATCTDAFGRTSAPKLFAFKTDMTLPTVTFATNPAPSASGWFKAQPSFQATGTDNFDNAPQCSLVGSPTPVTNGISISGKCTDDAGNVGTGSKTLLIDSTLPSVSVALSPAAANGLAGWYTSAPSGHATGTDTPSGIDTCQADAAYAGVDGLNKTISRTCTDKAGNVGTGISSVFKLDRAGPSVSLTPAPAEPDGANGWYVTKPTFSTTATDATSGVNVASCSAPTPYAGADSATATQTGSCNDNAGNFTLASSSPFKIDRSAPTGVVVAPKTAPNGSNGWYRTNPVVGTTGSDATSGIQSCTADTPWAGGDTATATPTGTCTDKAGLSTNATATPFKVDTTGPVVTVAPTTAPDGTNGWYKTKPVIGTTGTDATSGIASCSPNVTYAGSDSAAATASGSCTDNAGNSMTATSVAFKLDTVKPTVACPANVPAFLLHQANASVTPVVNDGGSGANPAAASTVNTSQVGTFTAPVVGSDKAGNTNSANCTYTVSYVAQITRTIGTPRIAGLPTTFDIKLLDANGVNVSNRSIALTAVSGTRPNDTFLWTGQGWSLRHQTSTTPGTFTIVFKAGADPVNKSFDYQTTRLGALSTLLGLP